MPEIIVPSDPNLEPEVAPGVPRVFIYIDPEAAHAHHLWLEEFIAALDRSQIGHRREGTSSHSQLGGTGR